MQSERKPKSLNILCPFYERECPLGERTALICWRHFNFGDDTLVDYEEYEVDCDIARWMFYPGRPQFN